MMRRALFILILSGCVPETSLPDECGARSLMSLVGESTERLPDRGGLLRIIPPGSAVTMDHRPERLNADLDSAGRIARLWCG